MLEKILLKINTLNFFLISLCSLLIFYFAEGLIGIDRFYHPDSLHYLNKLNPAIIPPFLELLTSNPLKLFPFGYYYVSQFFSYNYYLLLGLNFFLFSITNVIIFKYVFCRYLKKLDNVKILILFYLLFLEPYRLHLAVHILKETMMIFIMILFIFSSFKIFKIFCVLILEFVRQFSLIYFLLLFRFKDLIKILNYFKKYICKLYVKEKKIFLLSIYCLIIFLLLNNYFWYFFLDSNSILNTNLFNIFEFVKNRHGNQMPTRDYDNISNFIIGYDFITGFIIKNISWPFMMLSGTFLFFTSSILFKILGVLIMVKHLLVYIITKKSYVTLGLFFIVLALSMYTTSFTAMYRYCYLAMYLSVVNFFYIKVNESK